MEWLTTAPSVRTLSKTKLAEELGVDLRTLRDWQQHPVFRRDWEAASREIIERSEERTANVLAELYRSAIDPTSRNQVQAARLFLEATDAIRPKPIEVKVTKPTELSDEELDALLAQGAATLRAERQGEQVDD